jgi:hypothetical protein
MYLLAMSLKETKITHIIAKGIGTKTLGIFYLHILVLNWLIKNFPLDIQYYSCLANILKTFIVILICELLIMIIGKIPILKELV